MDNYVAVYYNNKKDKEYLSRAGYLEVIPKNENERNAFKESLADDDARDYYDKAWEFTEWFNKTIEEMKLEDKLKISETNLALQGEASEFNSEKYDIIKDTIINNLIQAMDNYSKHSAGDFRMPELTGEDWDLILNNPCFMAFMQGIPVGTTTYNDYAIVSSSENKEMVNENSIYYVNIDENGPITNGSYHRIWCMHLNAKDDMHIVRN